MPNPLPAPVDLAIVGAGAAGLSAAIVAARLRTDYRILILNAHRRPGAKLLLAGGGRCNLTNRTVAATDYQGGSRNVIRRVLAACSVARTLEFFASLGVRVAEEAGGKLYPTDRRAASVLGALLRGIPAGRVELRNDCRVTELERLDEVFELRSTRGSWRATRVLLATGGRSWPRTGSDGSGYALAERLGHTLVPPTPALVALTLADGLHRELAGLAHDVELTVESTGRPDVRVGGALLWTHFGISGPAVLDASRHWLRAQLEQPPAQLRASFLPGHDQTSAERLLLELIDARPRQQIHNALAELVPARLAARLAAEVAADRPTLAHLSRDARRQLVACLVHRPLHVTGSRGWAEAEVTAGGVALDEIDPGTLGSRICPGLFLAGEILDVDGRVGGFNLQWAWSSAAVAAAGCTARP